jgi:predicted secreted Zn-dependent protease
LIAVGLVAMGVVMPPALAAAEDPFAGIPNLRFEYYDVSGADMREIDASIRAYGPAGAGGRHAIGRTNARIGFGWTQLRGGSSCRVMNVTVRFSATIHLPRLEDGSGLSPAARAEWGKLNATVRAHEATHARIAYDHLDDVREAVASARCGRERARGNAVLKRIDQLQRDFDRRSARAMMQGDDGR